jgi:fatty acid desaturase
LPPFGKKGDTARQSLTPVDVMRGVVDQHRAAAIRQRYGIRPMWRARPAFWDVTQQLVHHDAPPAAGGGCRSGS